MMMTGKRRVRVSAALFCAAVFSAVFCGTLFPVIVSCSGLPVSQDAGAAGTPAGPSPDRRFWRTHAEGGGLVVIGAAARRLNYEETLALALEDAARKAALFSQVTGVVERREIQQSGFAGYSSDSRREIAGFAEWEPLLEAAEWDSGRDLLERDGALFVRVRFPEIPGHSVAAPAAGGAGPPDWTMTPPSFAGYYTGVGYSNPHRNLRDTVNAAWENAVYAIVEGVSVTVSVSRISVEEGLVMSITDRSTASGATIEGFCVLEIWIDPSTLAVWTLGVAKRPPDNGGN